MFRLHFTSSQGAPAPSACSERVKTSLVALIKMNANRDVLLLLYYRLRKVPCDFFSKQSVPQCGAEVCRVIETVSAQTQARRTQLSCCNTTTQSAAASGAREHFLTCSYPTRHGWEIDFS